MLPGASSPQAARPSAAMQAENKLLATGISDLTSEKPRARRSEGSTSVPFETSRTKAQPQAAVRRAERSWYRGAAACSEDAPGSVRA